MINFHRFHLSLPKIIGFLTNSDDTLKGKFNYSPKNSFLTCSLTSFVSEEHFKYFPYFISNFSSIFHFLNTYQKRKIINSNINKLDVSQVDNCYYNSQTFLPSNATQHKYI